MYRYKDPGYGQTWVEESFDESTWEGGLFGVGLGQGRAKWSYLPNAHNDFIFAIIGEELGFLGAFAVLALFATLAYTGLRIATRSVDPWLRIVVATSTTMARPTPTALAAKSMGSKVLAMTPNPSVASKSSTARRVADAASNRGHRYLALALRAAK